MIWRGTKKGKSSNYNFQDHWHIVQVQLYPVSYRNALFQPQKLPKTADCGVKKVKIAKSKKFSSTKTKVFLVCKRRNLFRTVEKT